MITRIFRFIRRKPKVVRDQYAFWLAGLFTAVVASLWFVDGTNFDIDVTVDSLQPVLPEFREVLDTQTAATADAERSMSSDQEIEVENEVESEDLDVILENKADEPVAPQEFIEVRIATYTSDGVTE